MRSPFESGQSRQLERNNMGRPKKVVTEDGGKDNPTALSLKELEDNKPITER